jgi:hypothetical protein
MIKGVMCDRRGLHQITVPFTRGICLGCWLSWHFGKGEYGGLMITISGGSDDIDAAAGISAPQYLSTSSRVTSGLRGPEAQQRVATLRARLEELNPPSRQDRWEVRDGHR